MIFIFLCLNGKEICCCCHGVSVNGLALLTWLRHHCIKKKTREREDAPIASVDWFKSKPTCNYLPACCNWYLKGTTSFWSVLTLWSTTPLTPFSALRNPIVLLLSLLEYRKCVLSLPHIIFLFFSPWKLVRLFIKYKSPIKQQKRWSQAGFAKSEDWAPVYYGSPKVISIEQRANGRWWIFPAPIQLLFMVSLPHHLPIHLVTSCMVVWVCAKSLHWLPSKNALELTSKRIFCNSSPPVYKGLCIHVHVKTALLISIT